MKFSDDGPNFPPELLDGLLAGEVVFVCGAGVSIPQLPGFTELVSRVFEKVRITPESGEQAAIVVGRFEEALGSLARRLVHESKMYQAVEALLCPPDAPELSNHQTLLRLSRDLDNRPSLVTTNFDVLFELAMAEEVGSDLARKTSAAGQSLPAPGAEDFGGVVHLHGRLAHEGLGLTRTPLVLTSAEYGDAYMRSGWASRFLFDLARCRTLVLVGYGARDAPVRYFLNVVQADRVRFADLRPVYALDGYNENESEAQERWSLVAVETIPYRLRNKEGLEHNALWDDLAKLAELVERPKSARQRRTREILSQPYGVSTAQDRSDLEWLIRDKGDLWDVVIGNIDDPQWIDHFSEAQLWRAEDPERFIPLWVSRRWTDIQALHAAARWCAKFGAELSERIAQHLLSTREEIPPIWRQAWWVLSQSNIERAHLRSENAYQLAQSLRQTPVLDLDLRRGVNALTPHLSLEAPWLGSESLDRPPERLRDLYYMSLSVGSADEAQQVSEVLAKSDEVRRICELASAALGSIVATAIDAELIVDGWDYLDYSVPSVEQHDQNNFHDGVVHLVNLLVRLLPALIATDHARAAALAADWRDMAGRLGPRLWLHALRNPQLFSQDKVVDALCALDTADFWAHRREPILVVRDRLAGAPPEQIDRIVERITREGPELFHDFAPRDSEMDWRPYARDHAIWVRLTAIRSAGVLTALGGHLLDEICARTPHLNRELEESDLFSSYSSGVRSVVGNPAPLLEAAPEDRLDLAHKLIESHDFDQRAGWMAYCRSDPTGALDTLRHRGFKPEDVELWRDLINSIAHPVPTDPKLAQTRSQLIDVIFDTLEGAQDEILQSLLPALVWLFVPHAALAARIRDAWWERLWRLAANIEPAEDGLSDGRFYDRVINSTPGKLAEDLLQTLEAEREGGGQPTEATLNKLSLVAHDISHAGHMARGAFARSIGFLVHVDETYVRAELLPRLDEDSARGVMLREVICQWAQLGSAASAFLKSVLLQGVIESTASDMLAQHVAAKVLLPCLSSRMADEPVDWGIHDGDAARVLRQCGDNIRIAAAHCLQFWQKGTTDPGPAELWSRGIRPLFEAVWPQERVFKHPKITGFLAYCSVQTGDRFPEAVEVFRPYLTQFLTGPAGLFFLYDNPTTTQFPREMLELLWVLFRLRKESVGDPLLAAALDEIKAAMPPLEVDRRFQHLERISVRFS
jgi:hypothetical protein